MREKGSDRLGFSMVGGEFRGGFPFCYLNCKRSIAFT